MHLVPELSYDVWNADDMLCNSAVIDGLQIRDVSYAYVAYIRCRTLNPHV